MKNVQEIYPVSPMQEMMLLHAMTRKTSDTLFNQFCFQIDTKLDVEAFRSAWHKIVERHDALRTAFIWEDIKHPQQVVRKTAKAEFSELDWRSLERGELASQFRTYLSRDRDRGFDLRRAPLMRFSLIRIGEMSWRFVWSSHHLIIDRWCLGQVYAELDRFYFDPLHHAGAPDKSPAPSFREYIRWIQCQDRKSAASYWKSVVQGFGRPSRLTAATVSKRTEKENSCATVTINVATSTISELTSFVRKHGLTSSAVILGAWALTLNRIARTQDALFGVVVAGRPPEIPDIESIVGSFINNVPVRILMPSSTGILDWLSDIQAAQFQRTPFEYVAPGDIQNYSDLAVTDQLFDTLLVWLSGDDHPTDLPMLALVSDYATAFPLTLSVSETSNGMSLRADCRVDCIVPLHDLLHELEVSLCALLKSDKPMVLGDLADFYRDASFSGLRHTVPDATNGSSTDSNSIDGAAAGRERLDTEVLLEMLREEWSLVLGITELHQDSNFFELGGSSLQAARLHLRIEKSTRQSLPLLTLFQKPTISGMAKTLFNKDWPLLAESTIGLRTTGHGVPLFCIASPEVNTIGYAMLTRHLPDQRNVYVLQDVPESGYIRQFEPSALSTIAGQYIDSIRKIQPTGPYRLLGMCAGSHISLDIARRFEADNETIEFLGIINTWSFYTVSRLYYLNRFFNILRYYAGRIRELVPRQGSASTITQDETTHYNAIAQQAPVLSAQSTTGGGNPLIYDFGFEHCDPGRPKISAEVTVFRIVPQPFWRIRDEGLGWSKQSRSVSVVRLLCDDHHQIMRRQHIQQLAEAIEARLSKCDPSFLGNAAAS